MDNASRPAHEGDVLWAASKFPGNYEWLEAQARWIEADRARARAARALDAARALARQREDELRALYECLVEGDGGE